MDHFLLSTAVFSQFLIDNFDDTLQNFVSTRKSRRLDFAWSVNSLKLNRPRLVIFYRYNDPSSTLKGPMILTIVFKPCIVYMSSLNGDSAWLCHDFSVIWFRLMFPQSLPRCMHDLENGFMLVGNQHVAIFMVHVWPHLLTYLNRIIEINLWLKRSNFLNP